MRQQSDTGATCQIIDARRREARRKAVEQRTLRECNLNQPKLFQVIQTRRATFPAAPIYAGRCRPSRSIVRRKLSTIPIVTIPIRLGSCRNPSKASGLIGLAGLHDSSLNLPACSFSAFTRAFSGEGSFKQFKVSFPTHLSDQKPSQRDFVDVRKSFGEFRNVERCRR